MKKSLSLLVAIAMVFSMFATVVSAADKTAGETLKDLGIITGTSEGLQEDAEWLRKDVTILLSRLYDAEAEAKAAANTHGFADLDAKGYNGYVSWAKEEGLFKGKTETTFGPNDNITNGQFATVVLRVLKQDQEDEAKNLEKAIELGLLAEGTVQTDAAKRGNTYTSLVKALDVEVDGKKLGNILGLKGYEIIDLKVESASAVVAKTITVQFNDELATIANADVTVVDANGSTVPVEKVTVEGKVATVSLTQALAQKVYTVKVAKATSKDGSTLTDASVEVKYAKGVPATVTFNATTVAKHATNAIGFTVKDADGNDITADFPVGAFTIASSNYSAVNGSLVPVGVGMAVVNIKLIDNNEVTTGNVTINVVDALALSVSKAEIHGASNGELFLGANNVATAPQNINVTVKNQAGTEIAKVENGAAVTAVPAGMNISYASSNPTVAAVVNNGGGLGTVTGLQAGSATVTVTVDYSGQKVTSSFTVTVKNNRVPTSFTIDKSSVTVVNGVAINQDVKVTIYDQYGQVYKGSPVAEVTVTPAANNPANVVVVSSTDEDAGTAGTQILADNAAGNSIGEANVSFTGGSANGTGYVAISVKGINGSKNVSVSTVSAANASTGYEVVVSNLKLDSHPNTDGSKASPTSATVTVYVKDTNGNRIDTVDANAANAQNVSEFNVEYANNSILDTTAAATLSVPAGNQGKTATETINVKLNGVTLGTFTIEIVASHESIVSKVVQNKTSIKVAPGATIAAADLIGSNGAFTAYNQYGDVVSATATNVISANPALVSNALVAASGTTGTTVLALTINGTIYQLTVVVEN